MEFQYPEVDISSAISTKKSGGNIKEVLKSDT